MKLAVAGSGLLAAGLAMACAAPAWAQQKDYPNRPIRYIVPYSPGGSTTWTSRLVGQRLTEAWGEQVIIDNRPGASTVIGTDLAVKSKPDGYTLVYIGSALCANHTLMKTPYDAIRDIAPIATVSSYENLFVVHPSVPVKSVKEFVALAKRRPGELNYATSSHGGSTHLAAALFNLVAKIKTTQIPYKGGGPAVVDLMGGQVQFFFSVPVNVVQHVKGGRLRALGITGKERVATLPDVPSFGPESITTGMWKTSPYGRTLHFGVREHAMGSILNGIALHGPTRPYGGTFLVFSDYMRPAVRLAALMRIPVTYVWTHDSIGLGEDGPTHQPIEHLAALRAIPGLNVVRPGDANETTYAWRTILQENGFLEWILTPLGINAPGLGQILNAWLVLSYLWLPYMVLPVYAGFERIPGSLLEASADLGGRGWTTFRRVILPLVFPALVAGSIFTFSLTLGDYITPDLVADAKFIGNVIYDNSSLGDLPLAAAYALIPIAIMVVYLIVARRLGAFESL